jgi:hypothetical protein
MERSFRSIYCWPALGKYLLYHAESCVLGFPDSICVFPQNINTFKGKRRFAVAACWLINHYLARGPTISERFRQYLLRAFRDWEPRNAPIYELAYWEIFCEFPSRWRERSWRRGEQRGFEIANWLSRWDTQGEFHQSHASVRVST